MLLSSTNHRLHSVTSTRPAPQVLIAPKQRSVCAAAGNGKGKGSKLSPVSEGLITVLKDELKVEKERYRTPSTVLDGPPGGYELQDRPNCTTLLLARTFGEEEVFVEVDINDIDQEGEADEDIEEDEDAELPKVVFSVNISKEDKMMTFSCEADGEGILIRHVSLSDAADLEDEDEDEMELSPYTGPVFDELDETLQQAFADYLEERGITAEFGVYLMELAHDKLEVEYMNWLQRAGDFITS